MPALTYPDTVYFYGYQPHETFPRQFIQLIEKLRPREEDNELDRSLMDVLKCSAGWSVDLELTTQPLDLFGNGRPYDCDDLVDFLMKGASIPDVERVHFRLITPDDKERLQGIVQRTLREPLFPSEKLEWSQFHAQLARYTGISLVSVFRY